VARISGEITTKEDSPTVLQFAAADEKPNDAQANGSKRPARLKKQADCGICAPGLGGKPPAGDRTPARHVLKKQSQFGTLRQALDWQETRSHKI
jgi:hypothetical protein